MSSHAPKNGCLHKEERSYSAIFQIEAFNEKKPEYIAFEVHDMV